MKGAEFYLYFTRGHLGQAQLGYSTWSPHQEGEDQLQIPAERSWSHDGQSRGPHRRAPTSEISQHSKFIPSALLQGAQRDFSFLIIPFQYHL